MLVHYIENEYTKDSIVVSIAGNFDEEAVCSIFDRELSILQDKKSKKVYEKTPYQPDCKVIVKDIEQSHLWLGTRGVSLDDELYYAFAVLNSIMGGTMSSRLFGTYQRAERSCVFGLFDDIFVYRYGIFWYLCRSCA